jgi:hypothetical protein
MACGGGGRGFDVRRHGRVGYVGAVLKAAATARNVLASGQADAKATRMQGQYDNKSANVGFPSHRL